MKNEKYEPFASTCMEELRAKTLLKAKNYFRKADDIKVVIHFIKGKSQVISSKFINLQVNDNSTICCIDGYIPSNKKVQRTVALELKSLIKEKWNIISRSNIALDISRVDEINIDWEINVKASS